MDHQNNTVQREVPDLNGEVTPGEEIDEDRWAGLIADGQLPFPTELPLERQEMLARRVSEIRRLRLLKHIAGAIAMDIHRSRNP